MFSESAEEGQTGGRLNPNHLTKKQDGRAEMLVEIYRDQHITDNQILVLLQDKCNLTEEQALRYLK